MGGRQLADWVDSSKGKQLLRINRLIISTSDAKKVAMLFLLKNNSAVKGP
jgi:hypothetical protein